MGDTGASISERLVLIVNGPEEQKITLSLKMSTKLAQLKEKVAEIIVRNSHSIFNLNCMSRWVCEWTFILHRLQGNSESSLYFIYNGEMINDDDTPAEV